MVANRGAIRGGRSFLMNIWITNAYDSNNLGDDYLLRSVLQRAAIPADLPHSLTIVSHHPESVRYLGSQSRISPGWKSPASPTAIRAAAGGRNILSLGRLSVDSRPDVVLVMAGGYTAMNSSADALLFANDHLLTLDLPRKYGMPGFMFPVSIGPLHWTIRRRLQKTYRAYHTILVRDDESAEELGHLSNTVRVPDLAVQEIAERFRLHPPVGANAGICLIARDLRESGMSYIENLQALQGILKRNFETQWRLQVPMDSLFYQRAALPFLGEPLHYETLGESVKVTVSVRLHGALMSILNGIPAIHLSYDRKGMGAYGDLGLGEWLHPADDFDPIRVAGQAEALANDPAGFWAAIDGSRPRLAEMIANQDARLADFWSTLRLDSAPSSTLRQFRAPRVTPT